MIAKKEVRHRDGSIASGVGSAARLGDTNRGSGEQRHDRMEGVAHIDLSISEILVEQPLLEVL
jgi:hypothetical protein